MRPEPKELRRVRSFAKKRHSIYFINIEAGALSPAWARKLAHDECAVYPKCWTFAGKVVKRRNDTWNRNAVLFAVQRYSHVQKHLAILVRLGRAQLKERGSTLATEVAHTARYGNRLSHALVDVLRLQATIFDFEDGTAETGVNIT